jgi:hypothetical protein
MKIRNKEQLIDKIANELSWRRRELVDIRYIIQDTKIGRTRREALTRASVALLYAHWEGFIKIIATSYLEFVAMQRCKHSELASNILAIILRSKFNTAQRSKKIDVHIDVVDFFHNDMNARCAIPYQNAIRSEGNLSSSVLIEILTTLGFCVNEYESKYHLIDNKLLAKRNSIAHGQELDIDINDYMELHDEVLLLMELFRTQIENSATMGDYLQKQDSPNLAAVNVHSEGTVI